MSHHQQRQRSQSLPCISLIARYLHQHRECCRCSHDPFLIRQRAPPVEEEPPLPTAHQRDEYDEAGLAIDEIHKIAYELSLNPHPLYDVAGDYGF